MQQRNKVTIVDAVVALVLLMITAVKTIVSHTIMFSPTEILIFAFTFHASSLSYVQ